MVKRWAVLVAAATVLPGALGAELRATVRDEQGKPVAHAVIVALPEAAVPGARALEQVEQIDFEFVPHVKAIQAGTAVSFPNRDQVRHHVYSFSQAKRFELPLYVGTPARPVVFDQPGVVVIGCNIHDWMLGYIYVSPSPYFATTGADGAALVTGLPAGRYTVRVWHPRLAAAEETTSRRTELAAAGDKAMEWIVALKPEARIRRAPAPGGRGRY
jgi:plastocyanin